MKVIVDSFHEQNIILFPKQIGGSRTRCRKNDIRFPQKKWASEDFNSKNKYLKLWGYLPGKWPRDFSHRRGPAVICRVNHPKALNICFSNWNPRKLNFFLKNESPFFFISMIKHDFHFPKNIWASEDPNSKNTYLKILGEFTRQMTTGPLLWEKSHSHLPGKYPQSFKYLFFELESSEAQIIFEKWQSFFLAFQRNNHFHFSKIIWASEEPNSKNKYLKLWGFYPANDRGSSPRGEVPRSFAG